MEGLSLEHVVEGLLVRVESVEVSARLQQRLYHRWLGRLVRHGRVQRGVPVLKYKRA